MEKILRDVWHMIKFTEKEQRENEAEAIITKVMAKNVEKLQAKDTRNTTNPKQKM